MAGNSNSGRKRQPAALHLINGNPSKKPLSELTSDGAKTKPHVNIAIPECPTFLTKDAKAEWKRVASDLAVMGVLARVDRGELAIYCQAWADWKYFREKIAAAKDESGYVETTPSGYKQMSALMQSANRAEDRMRVAGASFGMNPSARARLDVRPPQGELFENEKKDAADRFFAGPRN